MLVFAKEDAQTESFVQATERGGYKYSICKTSEAAMDQFLSNQPEVSIKPFFYIFFLFMYFFLRLLSFP